MKPIILITLSILILVIALISFHKMQSNSIQERLSTIAGQLIEIQSSPDVVYVGASTKVKLKEVSSQYRDVTWNIRLGDIESPLGDGSADACIIIVSGGDEKLGLRMKEKSGQFHILGFW